MFGVYHAKDLFCRFRKKTYDSLLPLQKTKVVRTQLCIPFQWQSNVVDPVRTGLGMCGAQLFSVKSAVCCYVYLNSRE
jgi:hypothetical protein